MQERYFFHESGVGSHGLSRTTAITVHLSSLLADVTHLWDLWSSVISTNVNQNKTRVMCATEQLSDDQKSKRLYKNNVTRQSLIRQIKQLSLLQNKKQSDCVHFSCGTERHWSSEAAESGSSATPLVSAAGGSAGCTVSLSSASSVDSRPFVSAAIVSLIAKSSKRWHAAWES